LPNIVGARLSRAVKGTTMNGYARFRKKAAAEALRRDADAYRLELAKALMREAGFVETIDGKWIEPAQYSKLGRPSLQR
jgi:hypothetical protein